MLPLVYILLAAAPLTKDGDFVKQLTPKDFFDNSNSHALVKIIPAPHYVCAIPLKEMHVPHPSRTDPMAKPILPLKFDEGMKRPAPVPACAAH